MNFSIVIDPRAIKDIQEAINYYDEQQIGLGAKFEALINKHLSALEKNPYFQIRYANVRCLSLNKFPFMVHFTIDEENKLIEVRAVFHTSRDPKKWKKR
jgi:toxin ParE1/3/4